MRQLKITKSITNRESASLDKYLQEIGREDLITVEEEVELAQRIRKGDRVALEKLTRANLRFVVSVAKQYQNQGLSLPDLINEGNLGLIKAAEKFDETRGFKFISYAVWWIRQSILQALAEQSRIVRLPLNQVGSLNKISKAFSKFEQENERRPSPEELADELEIPVDKISYTLKVSGNLTIEAGGTLALKSAKAQFSAKQGMEISSSANLSVSAQTELTQKAMMVDIKANAKGTLSAGAMLEVKGGLVKIN